MNVENLTPNERLRMRVPSDHPQPATPDEIWCDMDQRMYTGADQRNCSCAPDRGCTYLGGV